MMKNYKNAMNILQLIAINTLREDTFTTVEIQIWLPDFIMGLNRFKNFTAWAV